jgi:hypothetical protein
MQLWGGGGGGSDIGGGGAAGGYLEATITVTGGGQIQVFPGAGGAGSQLSDGNGGNYTTVNVLGPPNAGTYYAYPGGGGLSGGGGGIAGGGGQFQSAAMGTINYPFTISGQNGRNSSVSFLYATGGAAYPNEYGGTFNGLTSSYVPGSFPAAGGAGGAHFGIPGGNGSDGQVILMIS